MNKLKELIKEVERSKDNICPCGECYMEYRLKFQYIKQTVEVFCPLIERMIICCILTEEEIKYWQKLKRLLEVR